MVETNGYFVKSPVFVTNEGKYVISAAEAEFLGNITLGGNTTIISSTSITISDRIFGVGANNSATGLDSGFIIEHQDAGTFANIALIHHADQHRFSVGYTQNTFTDNHILHHQHDDGTLLRIDLLGNVLVQNNLTVDETGTFGGRVGIKTTTPGYDLDVRGTSNVGALSADSVSISDATAATNKTSGALQVVGGVGVQGDVYGSIANFDTVTGTYLYGTLLGSNTASVSDLTASGTVKGATLTGTNLYGTLSGSNTAAVSDLTASGTVKGATLTGTNLYGTLAGSNTASVSTLTASGTTQATSTTTGALTVAGGISTQTNVHAASVYISGGLITNTTGVTKKTYSFSGGLDAAQTVANSTIKITFSNHVFYAKVVAHLVDGTGEDLSTISFQCAGGKWDGTAPSNNIALGPSGIFGASSTNPWNPTVAVTPTTVAFAPVYDITSAGNYNVFIEYISQSSSGEVTKITEGSTDVVTFGY